MNDMGRIIDEIQSDANARKVRAEVLLSLRHVRAHRVGDLRLKTAVTLELGE